MHITFKKTFTFIIKGCSRLYTIKILWFKIILFYSYRSNYR